MANTLQFSNKGYNKYLKLAVALTVGIDYQKFEEEKVWDGLKAYVTNRKLTPTSGARPVGFIPRCLSYTPSEYIE